MSWIATTGGIAGELIRDLMLESVERRFTNRALPHPIEWLSGNGSCYRAREEMLFAQWIGLFPLLHARTFSVVERDGRVLRQNVQARLCLRPRSPGRTIGLGATSSVVRELPRKPSAQRPANEVTL